MKNTANTIWEKRLPPFSGLVLVAILLVTISWLTSNVVLFSTRAATGAEPKNIQITNLTDTSFTVTYQTDDPVLGSVGYGTNESLGNVGLDDRDQITNKAAEHRIHHITIRNLTPGSKYVFEISSGGTVYKNNHALYEVVTAPTLQAPLTTMQPLKGQVTLDDGALPVEGVVSVATNTSQTLTALLRPDGSYEIPVAALRTQDLSAWEPLTPETKLTITVLDPTQRSSAILLADQANPAPLMVLSKDYDFSIDTSLAADAEATESAPVADLPIPVDTSQVTSPKITVPKEAQSFKDLQPVFSGKALPDKEVVVTIQTQGVIEATVQSDANGNWEFRPTLPLDPGNHTITIKSPDEQGILQSVSQSFTVFAQGSQFIEPSISPPVLPTPLPASPSASLPTPTVAPSPTIAVTSTPIPTPAAMSPSPSGGEDSGTGGTGQPGTNGNPPVPNSGSSAWIVGFVGILLTAGVGTLLFFFI